MRLYAVTHKSIYKELKKKKNWKWNKGKKMRNTLVNWDKKKYVFGYKVDILVNIINYSVYLHIYVLTWIYAKMPI